ncbi:hypothetical protein PL321_10850 [Caloramator sp. mosi_1]|uniref:hypothetical protein n=1 Tax=Caloramator sp. mosi_1 TaxID=3023090 RepID=UPI0023606EAC|nr:hypothetical protein [Caloramator sp. mosi_1]WDC83276.1 hypothetical protein PL321_10850 [Caloramator sp. mosi_1]
MQIGIIPFKNNNELIINCDPIKQYEYLACHLPVITTYMPETVIDKPYTFVANTKEEFNKAIEQCLSLKIDKKIIQEFLYKNSWNLRAALLIEISESRNLEVTNIEYIGKILSILCKEYDIPIFNTLYGMYLNLKDAEKFKKLAQSSYNKEKNKYIEKQYIRALLKNNSRTELIKVILKSSYVKRN